MIDCGVDLNDASADLYSHATPLHLAVSSGSLEAVSVLVDAGAGLGTRDTVWNGAPLEWAGYYQVNAMQVANSAPGSQPTFAKKVPNDRCAAN